MVESPTRPRELLKDAVWLRGQLSALTQYINNGGPLTYEVQSSINWLNTELVYNQGRTSEVANRILSKLPTCEECSRKALYVIKRGPYYCEEHVQPHPTAQKVDWYDELAVLGCED